MTFREQLVKLKVCRDSLIWVGNKTLEQAWATCENPEWIIWILSQTDLDLTDPLCEMAERVLHLLPEDNRLVCSNAISAAKRRASKDELYAARNAAHDAAFSDDYIARDAANACFAYATRTIAYAVYISGDAMSRYNAAAYAVHYAARTAAEDSACKDGYMAKDAAYRKERKKQCDILREYFTLEQVKEAFNKLVS